MAGSIGMGAKLMITPTPPPIIVFSSAVDEQDTGDRVSNGGVKLYNNWCKVLRQAGFEAYICTTDGNYTPWLIEHQPHVSLGQVRTWIAEGRDVRGVTSWLPAQGFINAMNTIYYFDAELKWTLHFKPLFDKYRYRIRKIGTHSRVQQGWYLSQNIEANYIPDWCDTTYWRPAHSRREIWRIGYMDEGAHTSRDVGECERVLRATAIPAEFVQVQGTEAQVLHTMQSCDVFLGLNPGKHKLWGEGCPRSQMEAMHAGAIVIAYDVRGNREYLLDGFTGLLVPRDRPDLMAQHLKDLLLLYTKQERKRILMNSIKFAQNAFSERGRLELLKEFLDL